MPKPFVITRTFDAPRDLVWKMWTDAGHLAQWWGPKGCKIRVIELDFRLDGIFHYAMTFQPGNEMFGRFTYREISAPDRMVFVNSFADASGNITRAPFFDGGWPLEVHNTLTLTEAKGKTTLLLQASPINATDDERKTFENAFASMKQGWTGTIEQLEAYLATLR